MFGMGGFQLLPFYDALAQLGMRHFLINDERCGAFAAEAYARVTNRPGVCDGTLGPGATNLVTGLIEALNAGTPIVAFAGDTNRAHSWKNMTQECRQVEILRPAVKELIRVEQTSRIPELLRRAFAVATSGRPGPVLLDVPEDVCHGEHDFAAEDFAIDPTTLRVPARRIRPDRADIGARRRFARPRQAAADPRRRRHPSLGGLRRAARARRGSVDPGRAHDERKGRHRLHPPALGRAVRPLFADRQRSDRGVGLSARRRLQARRDRDQALRAAVARRSRSFISRSSPRRSAAASRPRWRCGATRAPGSRIWPKHSPRTAGTPAPRAPTMSPRSRSEWRRGGTRPRPRLDSDERPIHMARLCRELNRAAAGRQHPRRRWRVCRALDRAPLRYQDRRAAFHPGPRPGFDRLWAAGRDRGRARGARKPRSSRSPAMAAST